MLLKIVRSGDGKPKPPTSSEIDAHTAANSKPSPNITTTSVSPVEETSGRPPTPPTVIARQLLDAVEDENKHHKWKATIQSEAETLDYIVTLEEAAPNSKGWADIVISHGDRIIACEISVKTAVEYEVGNLFECIAGDYPQFAMICANRRKPDRVRETFSRSANPSQSVRVNYYSPEEFISFLYRWASNDPLGGDVERGKPRKHKLFLFSINHSREEQEASDKEMLKVLTAAMKRNPKPAA